MHIAIGALQSLALHSSEKRDRFVITTGYRNHFDFETTADREGSAEFLRPATAAWLGHQGHQRDFPNQTGLHKST